MNDWWHSFFEGSWLASQQAFFSDETNARQARFVAEALELQPGERVLDVPCGTGRIARELVRQGMTVTGVDGSLSVIEEGRRQCEHDGLDVELHHRDMRELPWENAFDAALCFWGSFGYLGEDGDRAFVRSVAQALTSGGRFLIDTHVAESLLPVFQERGWSRLGEQIVAEERRYDHETGICHTTWTYAGPHLFEVKESAIRIYSYRELARLLDECGFTITSARAGYDNTPFATKRGRLVVVARKR